MDQKIEAAPGRLKLGEHSFDRGQILDVASVDMIGGAEFLRERRDPFAKRIVLIGEGKLGAFAGQGFGYAPGDRVIIRDAHHQAAFAAHQARSHCALVDQVRGSQRSRDSAFVARWQSLEFKRRRA